MNLIQKLIRSERIPSDDPRVYETLDYYEMRLLLQPLGEELSRVRELVFAENVWLTERFREEINTIVDRFNTSAVAYVLLVGIPFAERYHDEPELRLQEDVDFLVAETDLVVASGILESIGYRKFNANLKRKHVTFVREIAGNPRGKNRLIKVKLYRRITDRQFGDLHYSLVDEHVVDYRGLRVFADEMALFHLIVHAHYYDFHPKILADIYMISKNGSIDWLLVNGLLERFGYARPGMIIRDIMRKVNLEIRDWSALCNGSDDIGLMGDLYVSGAFWGDIFLGMDAYEMTKLRCYGFDPHTYGNRLDAFVEQTMCRRVSPMRGMLYVGECGKR